MRRTVVIVALSAVVCFAGTFVALSIAGAWGPTWTRYCNNHKTSKNWHCTGGPPPTTTVPSTTTTTVPASTTTTTSSTTTTTTTEPSTTTTTQPSQFTGCVVVYGDSDGVIRFEGSCDDAATWVTAHGPREMRTYPYSGPACDPTSEECYR